MQEEIETKITAISIRTAQKGEKLTEELLKKAMRKLFHSVRNRDSKIYHGRQSVKHLMRQNQQLSTMDMDKDHLKGLSRIASKYSMDYSVMRDKDDSSHFVVFFKAMDNEVLTRALKEYIGGAVPSKTAGKSEERESLLKRLQEKRMEVKNREEKHRDRNRQKKREKNIER